LPSFSIYLIIDVQALPRRVQKKGEISMDKKFNCKEAFVYSTLATISIKTDQMDFSQNSLIAVTSAGIITGAFVSDQMKETLENDLTYLTFENIGTLAKESCEGASNAILLKDAVLTTHQGAKISFTYLYVFIEDILALSYGNRSDN